MKIDEEEEECGFSLTKKRKENEFAVTNYFVFLGKYVIGAKDTEENYICIQINHALRLFIYLVLRWIFVACEVEQFIVNLVLLFLFT